MKNYSKRLIDVIEYSREEAARLQNSYIGPEHLMLGIIREGEGEAMRVLRELHTDPMDIKRKIEQEIMLTGLIVDGFDDSARFAIFFTNFETHNFMVIKFISGEHRKRRKRQINIFSYHLIHERFCRIFKGNNEGFAFAPRLARNKKRNQHSVNVNEY